MNTHKRAKSMVSRASVYSQSTTTGESSGSRSSARSRSTVLTAATSIEDDRASYSGSADTGSASSRRSQSLYKAKKLIKRRRKSSTGSGSEPDASPGRSSLCLSPSSDWYTDNEDQDGPEVPRDQSERELFERLELARQNSRTHSEAHFNDDVHEEPQPVEEDIYYGNPFVSKVQSPNRLMPCSRADDPPQSVRPLSRASRASTSVSTHDLPEIPGESRPSSAMSRSCSPQPWEMPGDGGLHRPSTLTQASYDVRPRGPRALSPLPLSRTPEIRVHELPSEEDVTISEDTIMHDLAQMSGTPKGKSKAPASSLPRSKRQTFEVGSSADGAPRPFEVSRTLPVVEPLSVKRKPSASMLNSHRRRVYNVGRGSSTTRPQSRIPSLTRGTSAQYRPTMRVPSNMLMGDAQELVRQSEAAKEVVRLVYVSDTRLLTQML